MWVPTQPAAHAHGADVALACLAYPQVATQQKFRRGLPEKTEMMITKNSLMKVAAEANGNWSTLIDKGCKVCAAAAGWGGGAL